jgi:amino acid transporter
MGKQLAKSDPATLFSYDGPQPFVPLYVVVLGTGVHIFMNIIAIVALWFNSAIAIVAASRLVFAFARDGVLPFSGWISKVSPSGQPRNAVIFIWIVASIVSVSVRGSESSNRVLSHK